MLIYVIIICVVFLLAVMNLFLNNLGKNQVLATMLSVVFILFIGLRGAGYDYYNYLGIFQSLRDGVESEFLEPCFFILCRISQTYRLLLFFMALITIGLTIPFLYKMSPMFLYSVLLLSTTFLLPTFMGQMRQGVAIGLVAWAVYFYKSQWKFILLVLLACLFHYSALISFIILFLPKKICSIKYYILTIFGAILLTNFLFPIFKDVFLSSPEGAIAEKLYFYNEVEEYSLGLNTAILIRIIILTLCYWRKDFISNELFPKLFNIYHLSIVLYLALGIIPQLGGRGTLYFSFFELLLVPMLIMTFKGYNRLLIGSLFVLLSMLRYIQFFMSDFNFDEYVPYWKGYFL